MNYNGSPNTSDQSSIISNTCFQDISAVQNPPTQDSFIIFSSPTPSQANPYSPVSSKNPKLQSLFQENQVLNKKTRFFESSLKNSTNSQIWEDSSLPKNTKWERSNTQHFDDCENDNCIISLSEELEAAWGVESIKRGRDFDSSRRPKKFLKLAIIQSIGTLKF